MFPLVTSPTSFVFAMAAVEGVTEVRPKLYLSGREAATAMKSLTVLGISHILWLDVELGRWWAGGLKSFNHGKERVQYEQVSKYSTCRGVVISLHSKYRTISY